MQTNMDEANAQNHVMMMQGASSVAMLGMGPILHDMAVGNSSSDMRHISSDHNLISKQDKAPLSNARMSTYNRRSKVRASGKSDMKGDEKITLLHTRVQDMFANNLISRISDQTAHNLQCCVTYGKPCGCIRKFILAGPQWKESNLPNLRVTAMKDKDLVTIAANDCASLGESQLTRARELLDILQHAAELKKEKCYVTSEGVDGKPVKELRGMIGLGNGRKRSKKYEDFVLDKRAKLREEYCLCEKAAQKLLGYSINFLYKKLRTNPQRTSRLVATNKAERAAKGPRNLIPLEQLRDMANNQQSANQCCCRNCISWLVKQHFDKIVNWRKRLEGSGQRVAQEIVAEVLLVSASLDGQNSFCQNLVHWVTGCSFKKIRRVRDHLKKDPKSLPEHGLKKYWKEKGRKTRPHVVEALNKNLLLKTEKIEAFSGGSNLERFPIPFDARNSNEPSNLNNSNNRYDNEVQYVPNASSPPPPNRTLSAAGLGGMFAGELSRARQYSRENVPVYQQLQRPVRQDQGPSQPMFMPSGDGGQAGTGISGAHDLTYPHPHPNLMNPSFNPALHDPNSFHEGTESSFNQNNAARYKGTMTIGGDSRPAHQANAQVRPAHDQDSGQYHGPGSDQPGDFAQTSLPKEDPGKFNPAPFIAGFADPGSNFDQVQPYYFAANPGTSQDGFLPAGPIPLLLTQAQQVDTNNSEHDGNPPSQFPGQQFILLSPALPNNPDKNGGDFDNFKPMMMPLTPIQMYPASYFHSGLQGENKDGKAWGADGQHFVFSDGNALYNPQQEQDPNYANQQQTAAVDGQKRPPAFVQGNQQQAYFPPALTPLAVMQPQGNTFFSGWLAHPSIPVQPSAHPEHKNGHQPYPNETSQQKPYNEELNEQGPYFKAEKVSLPAMSQWASSVPIQAYPNQSHQWVEQQNAVQEQKKAFVQQAANQQHITLQQSNPGVNASTRDTVASLRSQMPPLAPIQSVDAKSIQKLPNVEDFSSASENTESATESTSAKPAAISDRLKRFSRDRLQANIDSPGIYIPPPLTPALTSIIAGMHATSGMRSGASGEKAEDLSTSATTNQPSEDSVFRFPPTYVPDSKAEGNSESGDGSERNTDNASTRSAAASSQTASLSKGDASSYAALHGETGILVNLSNVKPVPVLSLPTFADDNSESKSKISEGQSDQQLQTPTPVLNTPTHQLNSSLSQLSTPTHQLHTPNQMLNTPTQPLNTPTQPLNTPTQVTSPLPSSVLTPHYVQSPLKPLMPAPTGKKRKAENEDNDQDRAAKQLRSADPEIDPQTTFRKPSETMGNEESSSRRKQRQPSNPPVSSSDETIEIIDDDDKPTLTSPKDADAPSRATSASYVESSAHSQSLPSLKASILKRIPPVFSLASATSDNQPLTPSNPTQLNTPVLLPSGAVFAASGKMNPALLRRGSASERGSSSNPQFFTFMPNTGYSSPLFFAHLDPMDSKYKQPKGKLAEGSSDDSSEKVKFSPMKRNMTLNLSGKSFPEDGLQTPSKIPVVTPSAVLGAGISSESSQMFNFQDLPSSTRSSNTPEKRRSATNTSTEHSSRHKEHDSREKETKSDRRDPNNGSSQKFRLPSFVVDPPSDSEDSKAKSLSTSRSSSSPLKPSDTADSPQKSSPSSTKPSLHRTRSGNKEDLIISLNHPSPPEAECFTEAVASSPLNTPSGIQVITPTLPASKMTSPVHRGVSRMRGRPQPIMMTPICLTPGNSSSQVATPTFFHIVSPSQVPPSSPSVLVYPYPTRGSGPLSTGSIASPAFGFFQKAPGQPTSSNSASLRKSALMKKWPVFQFPPPAQATPHPSDSTSTEKDADGGSKEQPKSSEPERVSESKTTPVSSSEQSSTSEAN